MLIFKELKFVFSLLIVILFVQINPSKADTLMIISNGGGMYGNEQNNLTIENFGIELVASSLKKNYRKIYRWSGYGGKPLKDFVVELVKEQKSGEPMDVFSMQHGDSSFLPNMSVLEVESLIPTKMIRRLYSTGCSNWGRFTADADGSKLKASRSEFSKHMSRLGVEEYIIHANDNYTGPVSLPLLLSEFKSGDSWIVSGRKSFIKLDELSSQYGEGILSLKNSLYNIFGSSLGGLDSLFLSNIIDYFASRPVYGGSAFPRYTSLFQGKNMLTDESIFHEAILSPSANLVTFFDNNLPNIFDRWGNVNQNSKKVNNAKSSLLTEGVVAVSQLVSKLFSSYGDEDGCVDTSAFQVLVDSYLVDKYKAKTILKKLCFQAVDKNNDRFNLSWKLAYPSPSLIIPEEINDLLYEVKVKHFALKEYGSINIDTRNDAIKINISGISIYAQGPRITQEFKVPDGLMLFSPRSVGIDNNGIFFAESWTSIPGVSVSIDGEMNNGYGSIKDIRVLGKSFNL